MRRRDFARWMGSSALAVPFLELFERDGKAAAAPNRSKFVVFLYTPNGVNQKAFWPSASATPTPATPFALSPILSPFQGLEDKMLILGPQMNGATPRNGTGLAYAANPPQHQAPVTLSARTGNLPYVDQASAVNKVDGPSIDQVIADALKATAPTAFSSLNFGVHPVGGSTPSDIHFDKNGASLKRMSSADEAWNRVFGASLPGGDPAAAEKAARELRKHTAVSDFLHKRFGTIRSELSPHDRLVMDRHLDSLRTFEDRKAKLLMSGAGQMGACSPPARAAVPTDPTSIRTGADTEKLAPFFMDIIAAALACDLTRVASLSWGYPGGGGEGGLRMPWLGFTDAFHGVSHHGGNATALDKYQKISTWIASQVAGLMKRLAAIPLAGGTLLDQTTIYWFNRHGEGDAHSNWGLPNLLLGGTGGYFKMGRHLQLPATSPTKVLISIANAMDVEPGPFGKGAYQDSAPLSGLTA